LILTMMQSCASAAKLRAAGPVIVGSADHADVLRLEGFYI
jgi:hypothetical protein